MIMIYPQLVQYGAGMKFEGDWATSWETSADGKDWTFHLQPDTKWSDGEPLTAADAAWTINTTVKYADDATAVAAAALAHVKSAEATDRDHARDPLRVAGRQRARPARDVLHPAASTSGPRRSAADGKGLKTFHPELHLPLVGAGAYTISQYEKKGTTAFKPYPDF